MPPGGTTTLRSREHAIQMLLEWGGPFEPSMSNEELESALYDSQPSEECQCNFSINELPSSSVKVLKDEDGYMCEGCLKLLAPRKECVCANPEWKPIRIMMYEGHSNDHSNQNREAV